MKRALVAFAACAILAGCAPREDDPYWRRVVEEDAAARKLADTTKGGTDGMANP